MHRTALSIASVSLLGIGSGCAHQAGGVAPSTIPLDPGGYRVLQPDVVAQDCVYYLLGLLPLSDGNETRAAVDEAIASVPGADALIGVTADTYAQHFILVSRACTQVQGTAVSVD